MKNISFCATLKVDENLYKKLPQDTPAGYVEDVVKKYKSFVEHPNIEKYLGEDTIELTRAKYRPGYAVGLKIIPSDGSEPFEGGIFTNIKQPTKVRAVELMRQTYQYIFYKFGAPEKFNRFWREVMKQNNK